MAISELDLGQYALESSTPDAATLEARKKAPEIRGESILDVATPIVDRDTEIPDSLQVTAIPTRRHRWSRRRGDTLPKPADRTHYRVQDALRQLTPSEKGFQVSGMDGSGRNIEPITVFVDKAAQGKGLVAFSTMGDREARPQTRKQSKFRPR